MPAQLLHLAGLELATAAGEIQPGVSASPALPRGCRVQGAIDVPKVQATGRDAGQLLNLAGPGLATVAGDILGALPASPALPRGCRVRARSLFTRRRPSAAAPASC